MPKTKFDAMLKQDPASEYIVSWTKNAQGAVVARLKFKSFEALENFFVEELIGSEVMEGSASKVIGTTLLIWNK